MTVVDIAYAILQVLVIAPLYLALSGAVHNVLQELVDRYL